MKCVTRADRVPSEARVSIPLMLTDGQNPPRERLYFCSVRTCNARGRSSRESLDRSETLVLHRTQGQSAGVDEALARTHPHCVRCTGFEPNASLPMSLQNVRSLARTVR
jgi:hypothetical protein